MAYRFVALQNFFMLALTLARCPLLDMIMTGCFEPLMMPAAMETAFASGFGLRSMLGSKGLEKGSPTSSSAISSGSSMWQAPCLSVGAVLNAPRISFGMLLGPFNETDLFVNGFIIPTTSTTWKFP